MDKGKFSPLNAIRRLSMFRQIRDQSQERDAEKISLLDKRPPTDWLVYYNKIRQLVYIISLQYGLFVTPYGYDIVFIMCISGCYGNLYFVITLGLC